jgi:HAE1 family hydrophobic/amphiphilic exporter-1
MLKNLLKWLISVTVIYTLFLITVSCAGTASPAQQFPPMTLPSIQVRVLYPGADINTILNTVAPPLKDSIFHYAGNMDHMTYTAGKDGSFMMTVYFPPGTDMDQAALHISNLVAVASKQLPSTAVQSGITVARQNEPIVMAIAVYSEDTGLYDQSFLNNYAATYIVPWIRPVPGVSHLTTIGSKDSLLRIWLNKGHMAALRLTLKDVLAAIPVEQLEAVTGILYKGDKQAFDYIIKCKSDHHQLMQHGNIPIHTNADTVLRLKDVAAKVEFGPYISGNYSRLNGKPGINIIVIQKADSNYNGLQPAIQKLMETTSKNFPVGIKYLVSYNPKDSLYISTE